MGGAGGGKRVGAGAKPGESQKESWKSLTEEKALAIGLGWGVCGKCGEEGAVSWNGATRNPTRAKRPSFVPSAPRFDRKERSR